MNAEIIALRHAWKCPPGYNDRDEYVKAKPVDTNALNGNLYEAKCGAHVPWDSLVDNEYDATCPRCNAELVKEIQAEAGL